MKSAVIVLRCFAALGVGWWCSGRIVAAGEEERSAQVLVAPPGARGEAKAGESPNSPGGLREGWRWQVTVPEYKNAGRTLNRESRLKLRVEQGWLIIRRTTPDDDLEWEVVLACATDPARPEIQLADELVEVRYRDYLIRESGTGFLRIYRERKVQESPAWPPMKVEGRQESAFHQEGAGATLVLAEDWRFVQSGTTVEQPDFRVRFEPHDRERMLRLSQAPAGGGSIPSTSSPGAPILLGLRGAELYIDDGDLIVAHRVAPGAGWGLEGETLARRMETHVAPPLEAAERLNAREAISLETLRGRMVLLSFFSSRIPISVHQLAELEELQKKHTDRRLTVVGVHDGGSAEEVAALLKEYGVTFPVLIDAPQNDGRFRGKTAARYGVEARPMYFLIDAEGRLQWGLGMTPPAEEIERSLFRNVPAPGFVKGRWFNTPGPLSLEELRGKVVVLVFIDRSARRDWFDGLRALAAKFAGTEFAVVGIVRTDPRQDEQSFLNRNGITFPVLIDAGPMFDRYQLPGIAARLRYFLIDKQGTLVGGLRALPTEKEIGEALK